MLQTTEIGFGDVKKIGIVGGLGWPSTLEYYRLLCAKANEYFRVRGAGPPYPTPEIVIESLNMNMTRRMRGKDGDDASWSNYEKFFRDTLLRLKDAGADFGIIASNTPHMRLKGITRGIDFPVLSILDTTAECVRAVGRERALVLGTPVTMRSPTYPETLRSFGIESLPTLREEHIDEIGHLIDRELYQGEVSRARERILAVSREYLSDVDKEIICLACTELPLAFPEHQDRAHFNIDGITFVNTTVAHVEAALREALD